MIKFSIAIEMDNLMQQDKYEFHVNKMFDQNFLSGLCASETIQNWFLTSLDKLSDAAEGEKDFANLSERLLFEKKKDFLIWDDLLKCAEMSFFADQLPIYGPSIDFCCGYAFWTSRIFGKIDLGIDLFSDSGSYNRSIQGFVEKNFIDNAYRSVLRANVAGFLPLPSNSFQTIVSVCALEHIDRVDLVLGNMFRLLKPNGKLLVSLQTDKQMKKFEEIFHPSYMQQFRDMYSMHVDRSWQTWQELIEQAGFKILDTRFAFSQEDTESYALLSWNNHANPLFKQLSLPTLINTVPELRRHYFEQVRSWGKTPVSADEASLVCFVCTKK